MTIAAWALPIALLGAFTLAARALADPQPPPHFSEHAKAWALLDWDDSKHHKKERTECDDVLHPFASHPDCDAIQGAYREGVWTITVHVQRMSKNAPLRVRTGIPLYTPGENTGHLTGGTSIL